MALTNRASWALILSGIGLTAAGVVFLRRQQASGLGRGRLVTQKADAARTVGQKAIGGMKVTHKRSANMSIEQRVRSIQDMVWEGVQTPQMRKLALQITKHCPERDGMCEAKAVYNYVKKNVRYTGDVAPVKMGANGPVEAIDFYQRGDRTLEFGGGDCDDQAILNATLLSLNGIPARLRVTAERSGSDWSHIYTVAGLDKLNPTKWIALDSTLPGNRFGVEAPHSKLLDFPA